MDWFPDHYSRTLPGMGFPPSLERRRRGIVGGRPGRRGETESVRIERDSEHLETFVEISPDVDRVSVGSESTTGPPNIYLVTGRDGAAFIDTGYGSNAEMEECPRALER